MSFNIFLLNSIQWHQNIRHIQKTKLECVYLLVYSIGLANLSCNFEQRYFSEKNYETSAMIINVAFHLGSVLIIILKHLTAKSY